MKKAYRTTFQLRFLFLLLSPSVLFIGCAAINMNHFQDGRTLGTDKGDIVVALGTATTYITDTTQISPSRFKVETVRGSAIVMGSISLQAGLSPNLDVGGEFFTSMGGSGFKAFLKYGILPKKSKFAMSVMPVLGLAWPWFNKDEDEYDDIGDDKSTAYSVSSLITELILPISYHPSPSSAIGIVPKLYLHVNSINKVNGNSSSYHRTGSGVFFFPGIALSGKYKSFRMETTFVQLGKTNWAPYFGLSFSGLSLLK